MTPNNATDNGKRQWSYEPDERQPLLHDQQNGHAGGDDSGGGDYITVRFGENDHEDPRQWTRTRKMVNIGIIALMASKSPLDIVLIAVEIVVPFSISHDQSSTPRSS